MAAGLQKQSRIPKSEGTYFSWIGAFFLIIPVVISVVPLTDLIAADRGDCQIPGAHLAWSNKLNRDIYLEISPEQFDQQLIHTQMFDIFSGCPDLSLVYPLLIGDGSFANLTRHVSKMKRYFDRVTPGFSTGKCSAEDFNRLSTLVRDHLAKTSQTHGGNDNSFLIAGAGIGREIEFLLENTTGKSRIIAVERNPGFVRHLQNRFIESRQNVTIKEADLLKLSLPSHERVDRVLMMFSTITEFIGVEKYKVIRRMYQFLRPGGILILDININPPNKAVESQIPTKQADYSKIIEFKINNTVAKMERIEPKKLVRLGIRAGFKSPAYVLRYRTLNNSKRSMVIFQKPETIYPWDKIESTDDDPTDGY